MNGASWAARIVLGALLLAGGCASRIDTTYGSAESPTGYRSINGFGVLREMFRHAGWRTTATERLSDRLKRSRTLVWTPDSYRPMDEDARAWLDNWLAEQPGRTLVYVQKDYVADVDYWRTARPAAPPEQRFEYRRWEGKAATRQMRQRLFREPGSCAWFAVEPLAYESRLDPLGGRWAAGIDDAETNLRAGVRIEPSEQAPVPASGDAADASEIELRRRPRGVPVPVPVDVEELARAAPPSELRWEPLLVGGTDAVPLVWRLEREEWDDSQAIVVAGGSFLCNYGLLPAEHRRLAGRLIAACGEPDLATFVTSGEGGIRIIEAWDGDARPAGMELLTVWPLSLVTMHVAAVGLLALFALLPIFGRPRRLPPPSKTDFARHVRGVAELLARTGDVAYARRQISDYFVQVRGEDEGPWVLPPEPPPAKPPAYPSPPAEEPPAAGSSTEEPPAAGSSTEEPSAAEPPAAEPPAAEPPAAEPPADAPERREP